jgi:hypothetical protein
MVKRHFTSTTATHDVRYALTIVDRVNLLKVIELSK